MVDGREYPANPRCALNIPAEGQPAAASLAVSETDVTDNFASTGITVTLSTLSDDPNIGSNNIGEAPDEGR